MPKPLPLGVGGRAGKAPKRKQPTSAYETQEQVNAQADARIAGKCSKAQVSLAFAGAAGESASSQRGGAAPAQPSASDSTALQDSEPQLPLALPASGGAAPPELERSDTPQKPAFRASAATSAPLESDHVDDGASKASALEFTSAGDAQGGV